MAEGVDLFSALGVTPPQAAPPVAAVTPATGDEPATVTITAHRHSAPPEQKNETDLFSALGVDKPQAQPEQTTTQPVESKKMGWGDFPTAFTGSLAATLNAIPRGIFGGNTIDYGNAAMQTPLRMLTGMQGPSAAFNEGLQQEQDRNKQMSSAYPLANLGGEITGGLAGGAMMAPALGWSGGAAGVLPKIGNAASYIARNAGLGGAMSYLNGGNPVTGAAIGGALPFLHVAGSTAMAPVSWAARQLPQIFSSNAQQQAVGRALADRVAASPVQTSPVGPLNLAQATNNPTVAAYGDVAPAFNAEANSALQNAQQQAVVKQVGQIGAPATMADASTTGTQAIRDLYGMSRQRGRELWEHPSLQQYQFATDGLKQGTQAALKQISQEDPGLLLGMTGPTKDAVSGLAGLPNRANLANINSYIGVLKSVARRPPMDNPRAGALAGRLVDAVENARDATVASSGAPASVHTAYQTARDFTKRRATTFGTQDMRAVLSKNPAGLYTNEPSEALKKFFNFSNGSGEGPANLKELQDFADHIKQAWVGRGKQFEDLADARNALRDSARSYIAATLLKAARGGEGQNLNPKLMQDFMRQNGPWMRSSGVFSTAQIKATDDLMSYAAMLRRPEQLLRQVNSATQPRSVREKTFIDEIMHPWARRLVELGGLVGGEHHGGLGGAVIGGLVGGAFEKGVTQAEGTMRTLMAQALMDPRIAQDLMMKATAGNRQFLSPQARSLIDTLRAAVGSDVLPQLNAPAASATTPARAQ